MDELFNKLWKESEKKPHFGLRYYFPYFLVFFFLFIAVLFLVLDNFRSILIPFLNNYVYIIIVFFVRTIMSVLGILGAIYIYKRNYRSRKSLKSYDSEYISFFLSNFAAKIFDEFQYTVLKDDEVKLENLNVKNYEDCFFVAYGKILNNSFSMECRSDYSFSTLRNSQSIFYKEKIINKNGFFIEIDYNNHVFGDIKLVPHGNYQGMFDKSYKIENKKMKKLFKVYADENYVHQGQFSGEFVNVLSQLVDKLNPLHLTIYGLAYPGVEIIVSRNKIYIYVASFFIFGDYMPIKIKTKYYLKKMVYMKHLCEIFIKNFK